MVLTILIFLVIITALVLIHELGHFVMAKKFGIKVEEFGFGFPPRAFSIQKGETIYSLNWLPIGGFVKLYGEDEAGGGSIKIKNQKSKIKDVSRAFFAKPVGQRATVVVAGVVMNVLLAFVIFYIFLGLSNFTTQFQLLTNHSFFGAHQVNRNVEKNDALITYISPNSPADTAGIQQLSEAISVDGVSVKGRQEFVNLIKEKKGKKIQLVLRNIRTHNTYSVSLVPRVSVPKDQGPLGVAFFPVAVLAYDTPLQKAFSGITYTGNVIVYTYDVMKRLISVSLQTKDATAVGQGVSGPVGIVSIVGSILQMPYLLDKILGVLNLAGVLSVSLAFFNILPIPALDGGRLFFILIEAVFGRKVNQKIESSAHAVGMALLLAILAIITYRDIFRLFQ